MNIDNKRILRFHILILAVLTVTVSCKTNIERQPINLNNLLAVAKNCADPAEIERAINDTNNHISTVDLNGDGVIDYLNLREAENGRLDLVDISIEKSVPVAYIIPGKSITNAGSYDLTAILYGHMESKMDLANIEIPLTRSDVIFGYFAEPHINYKSAYGYNNYPPYYYKGRYPGRLNKIREQNVSVYADKNTAVGGQAIGGLKNGEFFKGLRLD